MLVCASASLVLQKGEIKLGAYTFEDYQQLKCVLIVRVLLEWAATAV